MDKVSSSAAVADYIMPSYPSRYGGYPGYYGYYENDPFEDSYYKTGCDSKGYYSY